MRIKSVFVGTAAAVTLVGAAFAPGALAGTISVDSGRLTFGGGGNEHNELSAELIGSSFRVQDDQAKLVSGTGCVAQGSNRAACPAAGITQIQFLTGSGNDTVRIVNSSTPATLNGGAGADNLVGGTGGDTLIAGSGTNFSSESLAGGGGDDELVGPTTSSSNSSMSGGPGADTLSGDLGNDFLVGDEDGDEISGGQGSDTVSYSGIVPVTVTMGAGVDDDGAAGEGDDVAGDIESVFGSEAGDVLVGTAGFQQLLGLGGEDDLFGGGDDDRLDGGNDDDLLHGEDGDDELTGSFGADRIFGEDGTDQANYTDRGDPGIPILVSINNTANDGAPGEGDNVRTDVEDVHTGAGPDTITGSALDNELVGGSGADEVLGSGGDDRLHGDFTFRSDTGEADTVNGGDGDDFLHGGAGGDAIVGGAATDQVDYSNIFNPLTITVGAGANDGQAGEGDNVNATVEIVVGGGSTDDITGGSGANIIYGGGGADNLKGAGGNDLLDGENPSSFSGIFGDTLNGGSGVDTVTYLFSHFNVSVDIDGVADDGASGENDNVMTTVENLIGTDGTDTLIGNTGANTLSGRGQNDTLEGAGGPDLLAGGASHDVHEGQGGDDRISSRNDGVVDFDNCGGGSDSVRADSFDTVNADCEDVDAP